MTRHDLGSILAGMVQGWALAAAENRGHARGGLERISMPMTLDQKKLALLRLMQWFSEERYAAGWMMNLERQIQACADKYRDEDAMAIMALADECGGWYEWTQIKDAAFGPKFVPFAAHLKAGQNG